MIAVVKFNATLMEKNDPIAEFEIGVCRHYICIGECKIINQVKIPPLVKTIGMLEWLMSRCMSYTTLWQANLIAIVINDGERFKYAPLTLSLNTNCASLFDWYWIQLEKDVQFQYCARNINIKRTNWEKVNCFDIERNQIIGDDLHCDFFAYNTKSELINTPIFTIHGNARNKIYLSNSSIIISQRKVMRSVEYESDCLSFLNARGVKTPQHSISYVDVTAYKETNDTKSQYDWKTQQSGFQCITKKVLSSQSKKLMPLCWFQPDAQAETMIDMVNNVEKIHN